MGSELMTGGLNAGKNPLSRISIAALDDMGYEVDYSTADPFTSDDLDRDCLCRRRTLLDMMHGETHALGLRTASGVETRRRISDSAYNTAILYGQKLLAARDSLFIPSRVVSVLVEDNGSIFGVVVRAED